MREGKIHGIDSPEIIGVKDVLGGDRRHMRRAEIAFKNLHDRLQHSQTRQLEVAAVLLKLGAQGLIDHRIEDDARLLLNFRQHPLQLPLRAHQRMHMLNRPHIRILHGGRSGDGRQGFAG